MNFTLSTGLFFGHPVNFLFHAKTSDGPKQSSASDCQNLFRAEHGNLTDVGGRGPWIHCFQARIGKVQTRIVFLDDDEDLRELMSILLKSTLGEECQCFGNMTEFLNHSQEVLRARVAILDINLGPDAPNGIDAFNWLMDHGFRGKILFLTGHARANPRVAQAERNGVEVLEKPVHPDQLIALVTRSLSGIP